jgi:hypothetical protein
MTDDALVRLLDAYRTDPRVTEGTGFGTKPGLRIDGHIFAMQVTGGLGVKLPAPRVAALTSQGIGHPMATRPDRPMREWLVVADPNYWELLAAEAYAFVTGVGGADEA